MSRSEVSDARLACRLTREQWRGGHAISSSIVPRCAEQRRLRLLSVDCLSHGTSRSARDSSSCRVSYTLVEPVDPSGASSRTGDQRLAVVSHREAARGRLGRLATMPGSPPILRRAADGRATRDSQGLA